MSDPSFPRTCYNHRALYIAAWLLAIGLAIGRIINGHLSFQDRRPVSDPNRRVDGNHGHTSIDFGGQWLMGRMLVRGFGKELFSRPRQWEVCQQAFPREKECPDAKEHDPRLLIGHFIGNDDPRWGDFGDSLSALVGAANSFQAAALAIQTQPDWSEQRLQELTHPRDSPGIGGPLYPPVHAFLMAPFAIGDDPQTAYFVMQWVQLLLCFLAGLGVNRLSRGRFWWPLAVALILAYPGCRGVIDLGQNSALSLTLLIWGWTLMARGKHVAGGMLWGVLVYKPIWAVSFFLLLLFMRHWRAALAMACMGAGIVLATVPFVGLHTWFDWLAIGKRAAELYNVDSNWIPLSRDILGVPRRFFIDFHLERDERDNLTALVASWALWAFVVEITVRVAFLRGTRSMPFTGLLPAMLILATWMCTYHFMYYDSLISAFGVCVLLADPRPFLRPRWVTVNEDEQGYFAASGANSTKRRSVWLFNSFALTVIGLLIFHENVTYLLKLEMTGVAQAHTSKRIFPDGTTEMAPRLIVGTGDRYPIDTLLVLVLWTWCWMTLLTARGSERELPNSGNAAQAIEGGPDIGRAHQ